MVALVCPKALLQQSKSVMRAVFSAPITPKPVYTLKFERGFDSRVSTLRELRLKLECASDELGIVIASPTAIKSFFLKASHHDAPHPVGCVVRRPPPRARRALTPTHCRLLLRCHTAHYTHCRMSHAARPFAFSLAVH